MVHPIVKGKDKFVSTFELIHHDTDTYTVTYK